MDKRDRSFMKPNSMIKDVRTGETGIVTSAWVDDEGMLNIIVEFDHKEGNTIYWASDNGSDHQNLTSQLEILKDKK